MEFEVTGLLPGSTYTIAVRAKNKFGTSKYDNVDNVIHDDEYADDENGKKLKRKVLNCGERVQKLSLFGFVNPESKLSWQLLADN